MSHIQPLIDALPERALQAAAIFIADNNRLSRALQMDVLSRLGKRGSTDSSGPIADATRHVLVFSRSENAALLADRIAEAKRTLADAGMADVVAIAWCFVAELQWRSACGLCRVEPMW